MMLLNCYLLHFKMLAASYLIINIIPDILD